MARQRGRDALVAVGFGLVGLALLGPWGPRMLDLDVYRAGAGALLEGSDVYAARESTTGLPFTYPVFAAALFVPFAVLPRLAAQALMLALSLVSLGLVCAVTLRWGLRWEPARVRAWCAPVTLACVAVHPVLDTLLFGQINLILVAMVLADYFLVPRRYRGILIGLATGIKLTPGLFLVHLVATRQYRQAATGALTAGLTVLLGLALQPTRALTYWTTYIFDPARTGNVTYSGNQSLLATTARLTRDAEPSRALTLGLTVAVVLTALVAAAVLNRRGEALMSVCVVAVAALLASPISWTHHWVWCVPCLGLVAATRRWWVFAAVAVVASAGLTRFVPTNELRELHHNLWQQALSNSYAILGLAFIAWAAVRLLRGEHRPGEVSQVVVGDRGGERQLDRPLAARQVRVTGQEATVAPLAPSVQGHPVLPHTHVETALADPVRGHAVRQTDRGGRAGLEDEAVDPVEQRPV
jgi:alpha-1,2-mannosyltransferase